MGERDRDTGDKDPVKPDVPSGAAGSPEGPATSPEDNQRQQADDAARNLSPNLTSQTESGHGAIDAMRQHGQFAARLALPAMELMMGDATKVVDIMIAAQDPSAPNHAEMKALMDNFRKLIKENAGKLLPEAQGETGTPKVDTEKDGRKITATKDGKVVVDCKDVKDEKSPYSNYDSITYNPGDKPPVTAVKRDGTQAKPEEIANLVVQRTPSDQGTSTIYGDGRKVSRFDKADAEGRVAVTEYPEGNPQHLETKEEFDPANSKGIKSKETYTDDHPTSTSKTEYDSAKRSDGLESEEQFKDGGPWTTEKKYNDGVTEFTRSENGHVTEELSKYTGDNPNRDLFGDAVSVEQERRSDGKVVTNIEYPQGSEVAGQTRIGQIEYTPPQKAGEKGTYRYLDTQGQEITDPAKLPKTEPPMVAARGRYEDGQPISATFADGRIEHNLRNDSQGRTKVIDYPPGDERLTRIEYNPAKANGVVSDTTYNRTIDGKEVTVMSRDLDGRHQGLKNITATYDAEKHLMHTDRQGTDSRGDFLQRQYPPGDKEHAGFTQRFDKDGSVQTTFDKAVKGTLSEKYSSVIFKPGDPPTVLGLPADKDPSKAKPSDYQPVKPEDLRTPLVVEKFGAPGEQSTRKTFLDGSSQTTFENDPKKTFVELPKNDKSGALSKTVYEGDRTETEYANRTETEYQGEKGRDGVRKLTEFKNDKDGRLSTKEYVEGSDVTSETTFKGSKLDQVVIERQFKPGSPHTSERQVVEGTGENAKVLSSQYEGREKRVVNGKEVEVDVRVSDREDPVYGKVKETQFKNDKGEYDRFELELKDGSIVSGRTVKTANGSVDVENKTGRVIGMNVDSGPMSHGYYAFGHDAEGKVSAITMPNGEKLTRSPDGNSWLPPNANIEGLPLKRDESGRIIGDFKANQQGDFSYSVGGVNEVLRANGDRDTFNNNDYSWKHQAAGSQESKTQYWDGYHYRDAAKVETKDGKTTITFKPNPNDPDAPVSVERDPARDTLTVHRSGGRTIEANWRTQSLDYSVNGQAQAKLLNSGLVDENGKVIWLKGKESEVTIPGENGKPDRKIKQYEFEPSSPAEKQMMQQGKLPLKSIVNPETGNVEAQFANGSTVYSNGHGKRLGGKFSNGDSYTLHRDAAGLVDEVAFSDGTTYHRRGDRTADGKGERWSKTKNGEELEIHEGSFSISPNGQISKVGVNKDVTVFENNGRQIQYNKDNQPVQIRESNGQQWAVESMGGNPPKYRYQLQGSDRPPIEAEQRIDNPDGTVRFRTKDGIYQFNTDKSISQFDSKNVERLRTYENGAYALRDANGLLVEKSINKNEVYKYNWRKPTEQGGQPVLETVSKHNRTTDNKLDAGVAVEALGADGYLHEVKPGEPIAPGQQQYTGNIVLHDRDGKGGRISIGQNADGTRTITESSLTGKDTTTVLKEGAQGQPDTFISRQVKNLDKSEFTADIRGLTSFTNAKGEKFDVEFDGQNPPQPKAMYKIADGKRQEPPYAEADASKGGTLIHRGEQPGDYTEVSFDKQSTTDGSFTERHFANNRLVETTRQHLDGSAEHYLPGSIAQFTTNGKGQLVSSVDADGVQKTLIRDSNGTVVRVEATRPGQGGRPEVTDALEGNQLKTVERTGNPPKLSFGAPSRYSDTTGSQILTVDGHDEEHALDHSVYRLSPENGKRAEAILPDGTRQTYDANGRLTHRTLAGGSEIDYDPGKGGLMTHSKGANGEERFYKAEEITEGPAKGTWQYTSVSLSKDGPPVETFDKESGTLKLVDGDHAAVRYDELGTRTQENKFVDGIPVDYSITHLSGESYVQKESGETVVTPAPSRSSDGNLEARESAPENTAEDESTEEESTNSSQQTGASTTAKPEDEAEKPEPVRDRIAAPDERTTAERAKELFGSAQPWSYPADKPQAAEGIPERRTEDLVKRYYDAHSDAQRQTILHDLGMEAVAGNTSAITATQQLAALDAALQLKQAERATGASKDYLVGQAVDRLARLGEGNSFARTALNNWSQGFGVGEDITGKQSSLSEGDRAHRSTLIEKRELLARDDKSADALRQLTQAQVDFLKAAGNEDERALAIDDIAGGRADVLLEHGDPITPQIDRLVADLKAKDAILTLQEGLSSGNTETTVRGIEKLQAMAQSGNADAQSTLDAFKQKVGDGNPGQQLLDLAKQREAADTPEGQAKITAQMTSVIEANKAALSKNVAQSTGAQNMAKEFDALKLTNPELALRLNPNPATNPKDKQELDRLIAQLPAEKRPAFQRGLDKAWQNLARENQAIHGAESLLLAHHASAEDRQHAIEQLDALYQRQAGGAREQLHEKLDLYRAADAAIAVDKASESLKPEAAQASAEALQNLVQMAANQPPNMAARQLVEKMGGAEAVDALLEKLGSENAEDKTAAVKQLHEAIHGRGQNILSEERQSEIMRAVRTTGSPQEIAASLSAAQFRLHEEIQYEQKSGSPEALARATDRKMLMDAAIVAPLFAMTDANATPEQKMQQAKQVMDHLNGLSQQGNPHAHALLTGMLASGGDAKAYAAWNEQRPSEQRLPAPDMSNLSPEQRNQLLLSGAQQVHRDIARTGSLATPLEATALVQALSTASAQKNEQLAQQIENTLKLALSAPAPSKENGSAVDSRSNLIKAMSDAIVNGKPGADLLVAPYLANAHVDEVAPNISALITNARAGDKNALQVVGAFSDAHAESGAPKEAFEALKEIAKTPEGQKRVVEALTAASHMTLAANGKDSGAISPEGPLSSLVHLDIPGQSGLSVARESLYKGLDSKDPELRRAASEQLMKLADSLSAEDVKDIVGHHLSPELLKVMQEAPRETLEPVKAQMLEAARNVITANKGKVTDQQREFALKAVMTLSGAESNTMLQNMNVQIGADGTTITAKDGSKIELKSVVAAGDSVLFKAGDRVTESYGKNGMSRFTYADASAKQPRSVEYLNADGKVASRLQDGLEVDPTTGEVKRGADTVETQFTDKHVRVVSKTQVTDVTLDAAGKPISAEIRAWDAAKQQAGDVLHNLTENVSFDATTGVVSGTVKPPEISAQAKAGEQTVTYWPNGDHAVLERNAAGLRTKETRTVRNASGDQEQLVTNYAYRGRNGQPVQVASEALSIFATQIDPQGRTIHVDGFNSAANLEAGKPATSESISYETQGNVQREVRQLVVNPGTKDAREAGRVEKSVGPDGTTINTSISGNGQAINQNFAFDSSGRLVAHSREAKDTTGNKAALKQNFTVVDGRVAGVQIDGQQLANAQAAALIQMAQRSVDAIVEQHKVRAFSAK